MAGPRRIDAAALDRIRAARAQSRELAWAQAAEAGRLQPRRWAGFTIPGFVLDIDATMRPENLAVRDYVRLANHLHALVGATPQSD